MLCSSDDTNGKNDEGAEGEESQRKTTGRKRPTKEKGVSKN